MLAHAIALGARIGRALTGPLAGTVWFYVAASAALLAGMGLGLKDSAPSFDPSPGTRSPMEHDPDRSPLCPSAQPEMEGSVVLGVVGGTSDEPRVGYLTEPQETSRRCRAWPKP